MLLEVRIKQVIRKFIREQVEGRTVASSQNRQQVQQQQSISTMMAELELAIADGNRKKLEREKRNPHFQKTIAEIGELVAELQSLIQAER